MSDRTKVPSRTRGRCAGDRDVLPYWPPPAGPSMEEATGGFMGGRSLGAGLIGLPAFLVVSVGLLLAGCGSSQPTTVRPPAASVTPSSGRSSHPAPTTTASRPTVAPSSPVARQPRLSVVPASGLRDQQAVRLTATGFTPGEALQVVECAQKGSATGPGDCNLTGMLGASADASGRVVTEFRVSSGPFGANHIVCSARQPCLISVTQASLMPTEEADAVISFAIAR